MKYLLTSLLFISSSFASDYPPGYVIESSCQQQQHVKVCAINQHNGQPQLWVEYHGPGNMWVSLNGRQGFFPLRGAATVLNNYQNVHKCWVLRNGERPLTGEYPVCPANFGQDLPPFAQNLIWFTESPKKEEAYLFQNAQGLTWEVELAFENQYGQWDSQFGQNYRFTFSP